MEIIKEFSNKGRIWVQVGDGNHTKTMPRANFIWMKANPIFEEIPPGYVVHHLDHNPFNDDPSNLVIMFKMHHIAHHFKQKVPTGEVKLRKIILPGIPSKRPGCCWDKRSKRFYVWFYERKAGDGGGRHHKIWKDEDGNRFPSERAAQLFIDRFWEHIQELNSLAG